MVFDCQYYIEINKFKVAATEFSDYALCWWDQLVTSRRRNQECLMGSWTEMKTIMRKRFVPSYYYQELHNQLRRLVQGRKTVENYYQELEALMIKADEREDREATMLSFSEDCNEKYKTVWKCSCMLIYNKCYTKPSLLSSN
ncbi:hypothetical protein V5N11_010541 [Cardamine amara subsp. amara]|uniref:Retrotransposon gag domain-containing protein n=1 Tax=Cardamine amara subsp. amara TaxID=228776 RepID=A0ABD1AQH1_CARAN